MIVASIEVNQLNSIWNIQGRFIKSIHTQEKLSATDATMIWIANLTRAGIAYFLSIK